MRVLAIASLLLLSLAACGGTDPQNASAASEGDAAPPLADAQVPVCQSQPCACVGAVGVRQCDILGQLGLCECPSAPQPPDAGAITVDSCPIGRYEGNFEGTAGFLIPTTDVSGLNLFEEGPPLQITLSAPPGTAELEVSGDGVMHGNANGLFPFDAKIKGKLDCTTKKFTATLTGAVQIVIDGVANDFTGTMTSSYDTNARAFTTGMWTVTGDDSHGADLGLTGSGTWNADYRGADAGVDGGSR